MHTSRYDTKGMHCTHRPRYDTKGPNPGSRCARRKHGGSTSSRRGAAGWPCGRNQSSTNTPSGVALLDSAGSGRCGRCRRQSIGTLCLQRVATTSAGSLRQPPVCHRSTPKLGGLQWFTGLLYHHERARRSHCSLPVAWCYAQRTIGEAGSLWSLRVVCLTLHDTDIQ